MTAAEAETDEVTRFGGMIGSTVSAFARENDTPINSIFQTLRDKQQNYEADLQNMIQILS